MDYIIGLDIGTTSTKAIALNLEGNLLVENQIGYPILQPLPTHSEQDPDEIFNAVLQSIRFVTDTLAGKANVLRGISCSSAMHSLIVMDQWHMPLTNSIIWADTRSTQVAAKIKDTDLGTNIYHQTGTPIHPMSPLTKIIWIREHMPDVYRRAFKYISIKEYIIYRLFGQYIVDYSIASATGLFDIYLFQWHQDALALAGIKSEQLSEPVPTTHIVRGVRKEFLKVLNIAKETPFIVGASDGCLSNVGSGAIRKGEATVTIGTSGAIRVVTDEPKEDQKQRIFNYILTEEKYISGGAMNNGAIILQWFMDNFLNLEIEKVKAQNHDPYAFIAEEVFKVPTGSDGLIFLPYLLGERAPHWNASARGVFFGIHMKHERPHFIRAVMEGVIFGIYSIGEAMEDVTGHIDVIYANGGFSKSPFWVQMLSDIFNKRVRLTQTSEGSAVGACLLGMKALHIIDDFDDVSDFVEMGEEFVPDYETHLALMANYQIFKRIYQKLESEFV